jgi:hypothetical protein
VLQASYNSFEQELVELRAAALETCQAVEDEVAMEHVDALAADAADALAEAFEKFLFPDAADTDAPPA